MLDSFSRMMSIFLEEAEFRGKFNYQQHQYITMAEYTSSPRKHRRLIRGNHSDTELLCVTTFHVFYVRVSYAREEVNRPTTHRK